MTVHNYTGIYMVQSSPLTTTPARNRSHGNFPAPEEQRGSTRRQQNTAKQWPSSPRQKPTCSGSAPSQPHQDWRGEKERENRGGRGKERGRKESERREKERRGSIGRRNGESENEGRS